MLTRLMRLVEGAYSRYLLWKYRDKAVIGERVVFGLTTRINHDGPRENVVIGNDVSFHGNLTVHKGGVFSIGDYSTVRYRTEIDVTSCVKIGSCCILSNYIVVSDNNSHPVDEETRVNMCKSGHDSPLWNHLLAAMAPIVIEDNTWIGRRAMINKGVTIGRGSVVAAGAIVTKSIPPHSLSYGNPAIWKPMTQK